MAKLRNEVKEWAVNLIDELLADVVRPETSDIPLIVIDDPKVKEIQQKTIKKFAKLLKRRIEEA